jgi:hypothetical protein
LRIKTQESSDGRETGKLNERVERAVLMMAHDYWD